MLPIFAHATAAPAGIQPGRTCRVGASIVPNACHVGVRGLGMLGADIIAATAIGEHGPGLMANDVLELDREYRLVISSSTFATGTLVVYEDGAVEFTGPGSATQTLYESSLQVGAAVALAGSFAPPQYAGVLAGMLASRPMPAVAASYSPPSSNGTLPAMVAARTLQAVAASYQAPVYTATLPGMAAARSLQDLAGLYNPPNTNAALPPMVAARTLQAIAASYQAPVYTAVLASLVAAAALPAFAAGYSTPAGATGVLPAMAAATGLQALAASYQAPTYSGSLGAMVAAASMPAFTMASSTPAWQRALREYTLLAPVDQIDHLGGFAEKDPAARVTLAFEFKRYTPAPASAVVTIAVWRGADADPTIVLDGAPAIVGTKVYQRVTGGVHDTDYKLTCMLTDEGSQAYVLTGVLPVRRR